MVLGMHRSGTSLCSHVLSALGLDMTDRVPGPGLDSPGADNPLGHWERWEIVEFHDRILRFFNREFFSPTHDFALPVAWWAQPEASQIRREIIALLERRMGNGYFGFKDPRTVRLMPMWHQIISELKLAPRIIFCLRSPAQVARSLNGRDGFSLDTGEYRWFSYTVDFFRYTKSAEICTIEYESWFEDPARNLAKLRNFLDLPEDRTEFDLDLAISDLVHHEFRHDDARLSEASQPLIRSVYKLARRADHDPAARAQLQTIAAQFNTFQQLQGAFQRDFEQQAAAAARLPELEEEAAALRARVAAAEAAREDAERWAKDREATVAWMQTEMAGLREALVEAERRAEESETAAAALHGQIGGLREVLGEAERLAVEREATAAAVQEELTRLREALAQSRRQLVEHEAAVAVLNSEMTALHTTLIDAERRAQGAEAIPEIQADLAGLSVALARAEQEVWERAGLIETMRAELFSLGETLAQTRHDARERIAIMTSLEAELAVLREAMAETERVSQQREEAATALRDEIGILRGAIRRAEQMREVRAADVARERETARLRETVTRAQRDAEKSAAAAKSLEDQPAATQCALTAARQVGRAAINALAMDKPTPLERLPHLGWRQAVRRLFGLAASA
jgi:hypothetical protein